LLRGLIAGEPAARLLGINNFFGQMGWATLVLLATGMEGLRGGERGVDARLRAVAGGVRGG
jgi:hypothetical protein